MRIVFIGTSKISLNTARTLREAGHEIVFIEKDKEKIDQLSQDLDCGFMLGDGSTPANLEEIGPKQTDFLFCLTGNDKDNIIASLVGRSLGFPRVITKIDDFALEHICAELGLEDVIIPTHTISRYLTDMILTQDVSELSTAIRGEARFYSFIFQEEKERRVRDFELPQKAHVVCYYRDEEFKLADADTRIRCGDEVVLLTYREQVEMLKKKWPTQSSARQKSTLKS